MGQRILGSGVEADSEGDVEHLENTQACLLSGHLRRLTQIIRDGETSLFISISLTQTGPRCGRSRYDGPYTRWRP